MSRVFLLNWLVAVFLAVYQIPVVQAAKIYKCQDENGHMTFSQSPCSASADIVEIQNREPTLEEMQAAHSVHQQNLQQLSAIERAKQEQARRIRAQADAIQQRRRETGTDSVMTSAEAGRRAMEDAGYREHRRLTKHQRDRVKEKKEQYNYVTTPSETPKPQNLHDPFSGTVMPRTGAGYTDPRTGTFYHDVGPGVVNTRTGQFTPTH